MVVKTDFVPALNERHPLNETQKIPVVKWISNAGLVILTLFTVFSGLLRSQGNLEKMGVSLGPIHM